MFSMSQESALIASRRQECAVCRAAGCCCGGGDCAFVHEGGVRIGMGWGGVGHSSVKKNNDKSYKKVRDIMKIMKLECLRGFTKSCFVGGRRGGGGRGSFFKSIFTEGPFTRDPSFKENQKPCSRYRYRDHFGGIL
jgi:hypothetical protein